MLDIFGLTLPIIYAIILSGSTRKDWHLAYQYLAKLRKKNKTMLVSARVYLNKKVRESGKLVDAFVVEELAPGVTMKPVLVEAGRCYITWRLDDPIPGWLDEYVEVFTYHPRIHRMATRICGIYSEGTAVCELTLDADRSDVYCLKFHSKKLGDIRKLLKRIQLGNVRPIVGGSYEQPQIEGTVLKGAQGTSPGFLEIAA